MATGHSGYSKTAITLHWLIAVLVLGNIFGAMYAEGIEGPQRGTIMGLHKSVGMTVFGLTLWRIVIRVRQGFLSLPSHMKGWEVLLARLTHFGFYALLLAIPLSGWAFGSTEKRPLVFFGLFEFPHTPLGERARGVFHDIHAPLGFLMLLLVVLHVLGALKHHVLDRDDILARMLPFLRKNRADA